MFRQDRTNPSTAISNWRGRHDTLKGWPSSAVSTWLNGGLFGGPVTAGAGYFAGGETSEASGAAAFKDTVDRFLFADDSRTTLSATLSAGRHQLGGMASSVAGYTGGGTVYYASRVSTVDRFLFSDDSRTTLGTGLSASCWTTAGMASSVAGYFAIGRT